LEGVLRHAAKAGYTGVLLADSKFAKLGDMDARYFRNVGRVKELSRELGLEIIPCLFPMGYSSSILWHDPNLAEGLPVREAPFMVDNGLARLVPDPRSLNKPDWKDAIVTVDGEAMGVTDPKGKNARIVFKAEVVPFRQYHISVWVKTLDFEGTPRVQALVGKRSLIFSNLGVRPTQDWAQHHAVFNSLENEEVGLYFGCWDGRTGSLWWKKPMLEEVGLLNLVRRGGAPLAVKRADGRLLSEGRDFETVVDPRMGTVPWKLWVSS